MKKKVYVLMISKVFPTYHPRAGRDTYFRNKILLTVNQPEEKFEIHGKTYLLDRNSYDAETAFKAGWIPKIHTIRSNYDLWAKRAEKINRGEAVLSLRQWSGKPYASKQVEFLRLEKIGVQPLRLVDCRLMVDRGKNKNIFAWVGKQINFNTLYKNDGLSFEDFCAWFRMDKGKNKFDMTGCVIHFTDFRY